MRLNIFLVFLLGMATLNFSCGNNNSNSAEITDAQIDAILSDSAKTERLLDKFSSNLSKSACDTCGKIVDRPDVMPCLQKFVDTMCYFGISDIPKKKCVPTMVKDALRITQDEIFRGKELTHFLFKAKVRRGWFGLFQGSNLEIKVALGIYTSEYCKKYDKKYYAQGGKSPREGRIGIFMITCPWKNCTVDSLLKLYKDPQKLQMLEDKAAFADDDPNSFDFGGLHP
jgi:hypothetical protein